jgi:hypothetical protein
LVYSEIICLFDFDHPIIIQSCYFCPLIIADFKEIMLFHEGVSKALGITPCPLKGVDKRLLISKSLLGDLGVKPKRLAFETPSFQKTQHEIFLR